MKRDREDGGRGVVLHPPTTPADGPEMQPVEVAVIGAARDGDELVILAEPSPSLDLLHPVDRVSILTDAEQAFAELVARERAALPDVPNNLRPIYRSEDHDAA